MSTIKKIREQEDTGEQQVAAAWKQAELLLAEARASAQTIVSQARELDEIDAEKLLAETKTSILDIQSQAKKQLTETETKLNQISGSKMEQAVRLVVDQLLSKIGA